MVAGSTTSSPAVNTALVLAGGAAAALAALELGFGAAPTPATTILCPVTAFKQPPLLQTSTLPRLVVISNWLSLKFTVNSVPRIPMVATAVFS